MSDPTPAPAQQQGALRPERLNEIIESLAVDCMLNESDGVALLGEISTLLSEIDRLREQHAHLLAARAAEISAIRELVSADADESTLDALKFWFTDFEGLRHAVKILEDRNAHLLAQHEGDREIIAGLEAERDAAQKHLAHVLQVTQVQYDGAMAYLTGNGLDFNHHQTSTDLWHVWRDGYLKAQGRDRFEFAEQALADERAATARLRAAIEGVRDASPYVRVDEQRREITQVAVGADAYVALMDVLAASPTPEVPPAAPEPRHFGRVPVENGKVIYPADDDDGDAVRDAGPDPRLLEPPACVVVPAPTALEPREDEHE